MIAATIGTFIWELTIINVVVTILLTTFPVHFTPSTIILMVAIFLVFVTLQWVGYVLLDPLYCRALFYFFRYFGGVKIHCISVHLYCFPFFFNRNSFHFSHILLFSSLFISSMVHRESFLLVTTPPYLCSGNCGVCFDIDIVKLSHFQ